MSTSNRRPFEAAITASQAVIIPTAAVSLGVAALALMPKIVTQQVAARAVGVSPRTVRNWIAEGLVTGYRLPSGRAIRVDLEEITKQLKIIPAAMRPRVPFGPKAKIINYVEPLPPQQSEATAEADGKMPDTAKDGSGEA